MLDRVFNRTEHSMPIRMAIQDDALAIHNLHTRSVRQLCSKDYPSEVIEGWLQNRTPAGYKGIAKNQMYVFEEDATIKGWTHVWPGVFMALFVDPAHARKGIGRALFNHGLPIVRGTSRDSIYFESTLTALPFYLSCGCMEVDRSSVTKNSFALITVKMLLPQLP